MRNFLVKHFALYYHFNLFGKKVTSLRCTRIGAPLFLVMALVVSLDPTWPTVQWYDLLLYTLWAIYCWLTFDWWGYGYFALYPVKYWELDREQQRDYDWIKARWN